MTGLTGLAVSRNVHFVAADGSHNAAIVTCVYKSETTGPTGMINVVAWNAFGGQIPLTTSVKFDPTGKEPHSWHWPEREE